MQVLDLVFVILLGLLVLRGFLKGFSGELFSIASPALAFVAAVFFFRNGAEFLRSRFDQDALQMALFPEILAFLGIFIVVFIAGKIAGRIVKDVIVRLRLDVLDKVLGLFLGLAEALALIILILFLLNAQPLFNSGPLLDQSLFAKYLLPFVEVFHV